MPGEGVADLHVAVGVGRLQLLAGDLSVEARLDPVLEEVRVEGVADRADGADEQADRRGGEQHPGPRPGAQGADEPAERIVPGDGDRDGRPSAPVGRAHHPGWHGRRGRRTPTARRRAGRCKRWRSAQAWRRESVPAAPGRPVVRAGGRSALWCEVLDLCGPGAPQDADGGTGHREEPEGQRQTDPATGLREPGDRRAGGRRGDRAGVGRCSRLAEEQPEHVAAEGVGRDRQDVDRGGRGLAADRALAEVQVALLQLLGRRGPSPCRGRCRGCRRGGWSRCSRAARWTGPRGRCSPRR